MIMRYPWLVVLLIALCGCDGPRTFKINGELTDGSTTNLYIKYYGNDAVQTGVTAASEGKFVAEFPAPDATIVEILDNDYNVLGRLYLKNGDEVNISIDRSNPFNNTATGTLVNEQWTALLNQNAELLKNGDSESVNAMIESYIADNPDNVVSTLMFASFYDASVNPMHADSVMSLINQDVRFASLISAYQAMVQPYVNPNSYGNVGEIKYRVTKNDSTLIFSPKDKTMSLLVVSNENSRRIDSVVPHLKKLYTDYGDRKLQILDIACFTDTNSWKRIVSRDSAKWIQGWIPGGILGDGLCDLAIPSVPYYIVTDSTGAQCYRGPSPTAATAAIEERLKTTR